MHCFGLFEKGAITVSGPACSIVAADLRPEMLLDAQADGEPAYLLDLEEGAICMQRLKRAEFPCVDTSNCLRSETIST